MIIRELILKEGMDYSEDEFSERKNLIFSSTNTKGKSTYLRLLFYSLGYPIPNMKGINFSKIETTIVFSEKNKEYTLCRCSDFLQLSTGTDTINYTLPSEHTSMLSYVFQYNNIKVLNNLLGFMYIDQDKGWSLLNRGTVIGKIKFGIEELLAGLNNVDIDELLEKKKTLKYNKNKYEALLNIQELSEQIYESNGEIFVSNLEKELTEKIAYINLKISNLKQSLKEINAVLSCEKQFFDYINAMHLYVKADNREIPVNSDTLVNAPASSEYLKARRSIIVTDIEKLKRESAAYESQLYDYNLKTSQMSLLEFDDNSSIVDRKIASFGDVNQDTVLKLLDETTEKIRDVNTKIEDAIKRQNSYITQIYEYVFEYAKKLGVDDKMVYKEDYIFTSDLKSMSGAVLQKMVFAFKVAFLKVIEKAMNTKLFMVLDSPKGKELDDINTQLIMDLVNDELSDNQVFIASIHDFECEKKIELQSRAIELRK